MLGHVIYKKTASYAILLLYQLMDILLKTWDSMSFANEAKNSPNPLNVLQSRYLCWGGPGITGQPGPVHPLFNGLFQDSPHIAVFGENNNSIGWIGIYLLEGFIQASPGECLILGEASW